MCSWIKWYGPYRNMYRQCGPQVLLSLTCVPLMTKKAGRQGFSPLFFCWVLDFPVTTTVLHSLREFHIFTNHSYYKTSPKALSRVTHLYRSITNTNSMVCSDFFFITNTIKLLISIDYFLHDALGKWEPIHRQIHLDQKQYTEKTKHKNQPTQLKNYWIEINDISMFDNLWRTYCSVCIDW